MTTQSVPQPAPSKVFVARSGDIILYTLTALGVLALGVLGWTAGGWFTILALRELLRPFGVAVSTTGIERWIIPLVISAIEVTIIKFRDRLPKWVVMLGWGITVLDFASTVYGIVIAIGGTDVKLFTGYRIPMLYDASGKANNIVIAIGCAISLVLTFGPEQAIISSLGMLRDVVTGLWKAWRSR